MFAMFRYTLIEALRRGALIFYLGVGTFILLLLALGLSVSPDDGIVKMFGFPIGNGSIGGIDTALAFLQRQATGSLILFGIFATAGLVPGLTKKGMAELFLSKPISRNRLLFSRTIGAAAGIIISLTYFIAAAWMIVGVRTGIWHSGFLLSLLPICFAFIMLFTFVSTVGIITRSPAITIMLTFLLTIVLSGLQLRELGLYHLWNNEIYHRALDVLYYALPQLDAMLANANILVSSIPQFGGPTEFSILPFVYSLGSGMVLYALGAWYFSRQDY